MHEHASSRLSQARGAREQWLSGVDARRFSVDQALSCGVWFASVGVGTVPPDVDASEMVFGH